MDYSFVDGIALDMVKQLRYDTNKLMDAIDKSDLSEDVKNRSKNNTAYVFAQSLLLGSVYNCNVRGTASSLQDIEGTTRLFLGEDVNITTYCDSPRSQKKMKMEEEVKNSKE